MAEAGRLEQIQAEAAERLAELREQIEAINEALRLMESRAYIGDGGG